MRKAVGEQIWFLGDVHGNYSHVLHELAHATKLGRAPVAAVFLGDIEAACPFAAIADEIFKAGRGTEAWFIPGNHDSDTPEFCRHLFDVVGADRNLHGRVVEIAGLRIAGLGGVFEQEIWHPDVNAGNPSWESYDAYSTDLNTRGGRISAASVAGRLQKHRTSVFFDVYETLYAQEADVLVTHEAPSCHPAGMSLIDELGEALKVRWMFHGHHHDNLDYRERQPKDVSVRGVGYRGIATLDGRCVRPGIYDG